MKRGTRGLVLFAAFFAAIAVVASGASAGTATAGSAAAQQSVPPNPLGNSVDCNGYSLTYPASKPGFQALCTDPFQPSTDGGPGYRFTDNGHYVGHDEPSVKFISTAHDSGNTMTYLMQLSKDPAAAPDPLGNVSDYGMLSVAPWFGLPMCDPNSYPQNPCTPASDSNTGLGAPTDAGSAFLEVQFYPPKFGPFADAVSCDQTRWCAAMTIDSLECTFGFSFCNPNCTEPVNFAYLTRSGTPVEPPAPQASKTFDTNADTLFMNDGDSLRLTIKDTVDGLLVQVDDLTTGQSGSMVASAANGFMNTNLESCDGTPFSFRPEYDTARQRNQVPWAALEGGVLMQQEIGHFEGCRKVKNTLGISFDPQTYQTCVGGVEGGAGEGPCTPSGCKNSTDERGACSPNSEARGLCEFADAVCAPKGSRPVSITKQPTWTWPIAACLDNFFQNGDLDFDGNSYLRDWPDGTANHPSAFVYGGPFDAIGEPYPRIQIESDVGGSESACDTETGDNCTVPPRGAVFYPFWTIGNQPAGFGSSGCYWNFGSRIQSVTTDDLGGTKIEYGTPDVARYAGTLISQVMPNPQLNKSCSR